MTYVYLILAIVFEVCATTCMKLSQGFTRVVPSVLMFVLYGLAFAGLALTLKRLEVSVAYAIWSAVGTGLVALIGIFWFKESLSPLKVVSLALIIVGVVGLHLSQSGH